MNKFLDFFRKWKTLLITVIVFGGIVLATLISALTANSGSKWISSKDREFDNVAIEYGERNSDWSAIVLHGGPLPQIYSGDAHSATEYVPEMVTYNIYQGQHSDEAAYWTMFPGKPKEELSAVRILEEQLKNGGRDLTKGPAKELMDALKDPLNNLPVLAGVTPDELKTKLKAPQSSEAVTGLIPDSLFTIPGSVTDATEIANIKKIKVPQIDAITDDTSKELKERGISLILFTLYEKHPTWYNELLEASKAMLEETYQRVIKTARMLHDHNKKVVLHGGSWGSYEIKYFIFKHPEILDEVDYIYDLVGTWFSDKRIQEVARHLQHPGHALPIDEQGRYHNKGSWVTIINEQIGASEGIATSGVFDYYVKEIATHERTDGDTTHYANWIEMWNKFLRGETRDMTHRLFTNTSVLALADGYGKDKNGKEYDSMFDAIKEKMTSNPHFKSQLIKKWKVFNGGQDYNVGSPEETPSMYLVNQGVQMCVNSDLNHTSVFTNIEILNQLKGLSDGKTPTTKCNEEMNWKSFKTDYAISLQKKDEWHGWSATIPTIVIADAPTTRR